MGDRIRIFATTDIGKDALDRLREKGWELEVYDHLEAPPKTLILERVRSGVDALITTLRDEIDDEVFSAGAAAGLRVVAQDAVGFDNIDRKAANSHRIPFTHTPDVLTDATAEFAFFLLGAVSRRLFPAELQGRENEWTTWHPYLPMLGDEVSGRILAVIGTGRIGKSVANKATAFDMDILCHDPAYEDEKFVASVRKVMDVRHREGLSTRQQTIEYVSLEEALRRADFVSLHVPLIRPGTGGPATYHLMNEERFGLMKSTAYLVNTSRGPVVDEEALAKALAGADCRGRPRRLRDGAASRRQPSSRSILARDAPAVSPRRVRGSGHSSLARSRRGHGRPLRAGRYRRPRREPRRRSREDAVRGQ